MVLYDIATHFRVAAVYECFEVNCNIAMPRHKFKKARKQNKETNNQKKKIQNEKSYMLLKIVASSDNHLSHCFSFIV